MYKNKYFKNVYKKNEKKKIINEHWNFKTFSTFLSEREVNP